MDKGARAANQPLFLSFFLVIPLSGKNREFTLERKERSESGAVPLFTPFARCATIDARSKL